MGKNESASDRVVRLVIGVAALVAGLVIGSGSVTGIVLFVVAAVMLLTGAVGFCPLYAIFRINTAGRAR